MGSVDSLVPPGLVIKKKAAEGAALTGDLRPALDSPWLVQDLSFIVQNSKKGPDGKRADLALVNK